MTHIITAAGHNGTIIFDGQMITIQRSGLLARTSVGKGTKAVSVAQVSAVQFKPAGPLMNGYIQFTIPGGAERRSRAGSATRDAVHDENSVIFTRKQMPVFAQLRDAVQAAIVARASGAPVDVPAGPDVATRMTQLASLRDQGLISEHEYEQKRQQLFDQF